MLKTIAINAFEECTNLKVICVEDDCECSFSDIELPCSARVLLPQETMSRLGFSLEQRGLKEITFSEGTEKIGCRWFWNSEIESVTIPSDIRKIGTEAFYNCKKLTKLVFREFRTEKGYTVNEAYAS